MLSHLKKKINTKFMKRWDDEIFLLFKSLLSQIKYMQSKPVREWLYLIWYSSEWSKGLFISLFTAFCWSIVGRKVIMPLEFTCRSTFNKLCMHENKYLLENSAETETWFPFLRLVCVVVGKTAIGNCL